MEIGDRTQKAYFQQLEEEQRAFQRQIFIIVILFILILYILFNKTDIIEQIVFNKIALVNKYNIQINEDYKQLSDDNITILFRYDEEQLKDKEKSSMYRLDNEENHEIQTKKDILLNIENTLNETKAERLGYKNKYGDYGEYGYSIITLDTQCLTYESNISHQDLTTLKRFIEQEPTDTTTMIFTDSTNEGETIEDKLKQEPQNQNQNTNQSQVEWWQPHLTRAKESHPSYKTYTTIITFDNTNGIIVGTCENKEEIIIKMNKTLEELKFISKLQKTSII